MIEIHVRIENVYIDPLDRSPDAMTATFDKTAGDPAEVKTLQIATPAPNVAVVTLELDVPDLPDEFASEDEWEDWGAEMLLPFTGIGNPEGDCGYFVEIVECKHTDYQYAVGRTWEWGT